MISEEFAVLLGPILLGAVLGPMLIKLMDTTTQRAVAANYEALSDKARFEAMDIVIKNLRQEADRLQAEVQVERRYSLEMRQRVVELERGPPPEQGLF